MAIAQTRLRIGFVGAGVAAQRHYALLRERDDIECVAVCDIAAERAQTFAQKIGAEAHTSVERMLRAQVLDAVWVCVPPRAHGPLEVRLAEAGCALWIEPPLALSTRTLNSLSATFKRTGVPICVGSAWRYSTALERAKRLLSGKGTPTPMLLNGFWAENEPVTAWRHDDKTGGGLWLEGAWPLLDVARMLCGEPRRVGAYGALQNPSSAAKSHGSNARDVSAMWVEFTSGAVGSFAASRVGPQTSRLEIVTNQGIATLEGFDGPRVTFTWQGQGETLRVAPEEDALQLAHEAFLRAVTQGKRLDLRATYADASKTFAWALGATRAMSGSKPVVLAVK